MNYAFGHPDSPMLLVPTAPLANYINHGGVFESEKPQSEGANVMVRLNNGIISTCTSSRDGMKLPENLSLLPWAMQGLMPPSEALESDSAMTM